jgi:hypothetical protein
MQAEEHWRIPHILRPEGSGRESQSMLSSEEVVVLMTPQLAASMESPVKYASRTREIVDQGEVCLTSRLSYRDCDDTYIDRIVPVDPSSHGIERIWPLLSAQHAEHSPSGAGVSHLRALHR